MTIMLDHGHRTGGVERFSAGFPDIHGQTDAGMMMAAATAHICHFRYQTVLSIPMPLIDLTSYPNGD